MIINCVNTISLSSLLRNFSRISVISSLESAKMPQLDIHSKPFDEATLTKLNIFEDYLRSWLPVFINLTGSIRIYDFFAGEGQDVNGNPGSPLRIIRTIDEFRDFLLKRGKKIELLFNDSNKLKYTTLKKLVDVEFERNPGLDQIFNYKIKNTKFENIFVNMETSLLMGNNLIFIDQNGVKQVTKKVFLKLESYPKTDFIFFISSSFCNRFDYSKYLPGLNIDADCDKFCDIHRKMVEHYRSWIPPHSNLKIYPFTLKKEQSGNIHGLIFGSKHPLGVEKFLKVAWKENNTNGEANFDIDDDESKDQMLFDFMKPQLKKVEKFQKSLETKILESKSITNKEILDYTLELGHIPKHAIDVVNRLKKKGMIKHFSYPKIGCKQVYSNNEIVSFEVNQS